MKTGIHQGATGGHVAGDPLAEPAFGAEGNQGGTGILAVALFHGRLKGAQLVTVHEF